MRPPAGSREPVLAALAVVLSVAVLAGLPGPAEGAADAAADAAAVDEHVHIVGIDYDPNDVTILLDETVGWDNHDGVTHTVTSASFDSGDLQSGDTYERAFDAAGTFAYECLYHPWMQGTVDVLDPDAEPDLVVSRLTASDGTPGLSKRIHVTVKNVGDAPADASEVRVRYMYKGEWHAIGTAAVPALDSGGTHRATLVWDTTGKVGDFPVEALADAGDAVAEGDEDNNRAETTVSVLVEGVPGTDLTDP